MPLRRLLQQLMNQEHVIQKLSETYPIRRAAQLTAFFLQKGKERIEEIKESEVADRFREAARDTASEADRKKNESMNKVNSFVQNFMSELDKEWEKEKEKKNLGSGEQSNSSSQDKEKK